MHYELKAFLFMHVKKVGIEITRFFTSLPTRLFTAIKKWFSVHIFSFSSRFCRHFDHLILKPDKDDISGQLKREGRGGGDRYRQRARIGVDVDINKVICIKNSDKCLFLDLFCNMLVSVRVRSVLSS